MDKYVNQLTEVTSAGNDDVIPIQPVGVAGLRYIKKSNLVTDSGNSALGTFNPSAVVVNQNGYYTAYNPTGNTTIVFSGTPKNGVWQVVEILLEAGESISWPAETRIYEDSITKDVAPGAGTYELWIGYEANRYRLLLSNFADEPAVAPTLSNFLINDANPDRIYFDSSEIITATTFGGFTVASPSKTITAINIATGATTGHYFTVNSAFVESNSPTIAYSGTGSDLQDADSAALASFTATNITNNVVDPPTLQTAETGAVADNILAITTDKAVNVTTAGWSIATDGAALSISSVNSGSGTTSFQFLLSRSVLSAETITISYDQGTGNTVATSGGKELNMVTNQSVTNNVASFSDPTDIPELEVWLPMTTATVTQDTGGISSANDQSGNANHFTQATSGQRPELVTDTGKEYADFVDANNDYLSASQSFQSIMRSSFSFACAVKPDDGQAAAFQRLFGCTISTPTANGVFGAIIRSDGKIEARYYSNDVVVIAITNNVVFTDGAQSSEKIIIVSFTELNNININVDGSDLALDPANNGDMSSVDMSVMANTSNLSIGGTIVNGSFGTTTNYNGLLRHFMLFSKALSSENKTDITNYISNN